MDVSDMVEHNLGLLDPNNLSHSYFSLSRTDPTIGFPFDASQVAGKTYPDVSEKRSGR